MPPRAHEVSQRDLRLRSREIMDAVEHGESFTVTRDGRGIGELMPLRIRRRFVARADFIAGSRQLVDIDLEGFRADQEAAFDTEVDDPYAR
ncbi:hypothetical protein GCM10022237_22860 [Nocardioides ginsengisoli]